MSRLTEEQIRALCLIALAPEERPEGTRKILHRTAIALVREGWAMPKPGAFDQFLDRIEKSKQAADYIHVLELTRDGARLYEEIISECGTPPLEVLR